MSSHYGDWHVTYADDGILLDSRVEPKGVVISYKDWNEMVLAEAAYIKAVELTHARGRDALNASNVTPDRLVYVDEDDSLAPKYRVTPRERHDRGDCPDDCSWCGTEK